MSDSVWIAIISGFFSLVSAFGSILLKDMLDRRSTNIANDEQPNRDVNTSEKIHPTLSPPSINSSNIGHSLKFSPLYFALFGFFIGVLTRFFRPFFTGSINYESLIGLALLYLISLFLIVREMKNEKHPSFLSAILTLTALWAGNAAGWSLMHGKIWDDLVAVTAGNWLVCAGFTGFLFLLSRWKGR